MLGLSIWWRLGWFALGLAVGFYFILRPLQVVSMVGKSVWAEEKFGPGGTYTAVKLFGVVVIITAVIVLVNF